MAELTTKPRPVAKTEATNQPSIPAVHVGSVVDRTKTLSDGFWPPSRPVSGLRSKRSGSS